jgi:hypothetical protein
MKFIFKVIRNTAILGLVYFFSNYATYVNFSPDEFKALIIFCGLYFSAELANHYHVSTNSKRGAIKIDTLIL